MLGNPLSVLGNRGVDSRVVFVGALHAERNNPGQFIPNDGRSTGVTLARVRYSVSGAEHFFGYGDVFHEGVPLTAQVVLNYGSACREQRLGHRLFRLFHYNNYNVTVL